jgi:hypothetical protein
MSEPTPRFESFEQFWPFYVRAHSRRENRLLHVAGTTAAMAALASALLFRKKGLLKWVPVVGYGPAWIGHFFIEGNRPATFGHPLWSLRGDLVMWWKTLTGTMDAELERARAGARDANGVPAEGPPAEPGPNPQDVN